MFHRITIFVSILCLALLTALGILDYFFLDDNSPLQDYVRGIFTETIGILLTVLVVERLFELHDRKQEREQEIESLRNSHRVCVQYINRFHLYAYQVITPINIRANKVLATRCPETWEFNDMRDLFSESLLIFDGQTPSVLRCLATLRDLQLHIEGILARLPLQYFPQLSGTLLHFIESVGRVDLYEGIKFDSEARLGEEKMKDFVKKMIANHQGKPEYRGSNVITKYVALYYVLQDAVKLLNQYEMQLAEALKSERL
jgi:hypothetical protein